MVVLDPRDDEKRKERAEVDGPIKRAVGLLQQMRLLRFELVAHERRHARLDAARTEGDQRQAAAQAEQPAVRGWNKATGGQHAVPQAIEQRDPQNRVVPANQAILQPGPKQRHEIVGEFEEMDDLGGIVVLQAQAAFGGHRRDIAGQNPDHAVVAEAFARLVADDELDLRRPAAVGSG